MLWETLEIKFRQAADSNDLYEGDFISFHKAAVEILSIMKIISSTKCDLYVSYEIDDFLKNYGFDKEYNYKIDSTLKYLEMNIK